MAAVHEPGKYDDACTLAREASGGQTVLLIVLHGHAGSGFSVQSMDPRVHVWIPEILRRVADEIDGGNDGDPENAGDGRSAS